MLRSGRNTHGLLADDADVLRMRVECVEGDVCRASDEGRSAERMTRAASGGGGGRRTLADEEADADPAHVEPVEELLDAEADPVRLLRVLPLEDAAAGHGERSESA